MASQPERIAERAYARVYRTSGKAPLLAFLKDAVTRSGGQVLYASAHTRAPIYLGVDVGGRERLGILCYPFRCTGMVTKNRPNDEHRAQIRLGSEPSWRDEHPLGIDVAGVDVTVVLGLHLEAGIMIGLDPLLYDPLPMGISIEFKTRDVEETLRTGWHAWERPNRAGQVRIARSEVGLETVIAFRPERFLDYVRLEREASSLGLDPVLRMRAALAAAQPITTVPTRHLLEEAFHVRSLEMLDIIAKRKRLQVAVRGGVAEHHLEKALSSDPDVSEVAEVDVDGPPDLEATLQTGLLLRVECKNGEDNAYSDGAGRVEVQKTRTSKGDPASRFYRPDQFDVLAVCLWPAGGGAPRFVYRNTGDLARHRDFPDRLAVMHRIDGTWATRIARAAA